MKKDSEYSISIVMPAYNEERNIEKSIISLSRQMSQLGNQYEVIVVDDGSKDGTFNILDRLKQTHPELKVIRHAFNQRLGATLRSGFRAAQNELVFYTDTDLPIDFREVSRAIRVLNLKDASMVAGFRHDRTNEGALRIFYSLVYNWLIRLMFGVYIRDINFSFKLLKKELLEKLELKSKGSFIDAEIVIKAHYFKAYICQIGVDYFKRSSGTSTLSSPKVIFNMLKEMTQLFPELRRVKKLNHHAP